MRKSNPPLTRGASTQSVLIDKAIEIASRRPIERHKQRKKHIRIVAIITNKKGHILSIGMNSYYKTHPKQNYWSQKSNLKGKNAKNFLHAEIDAITSCENLHQAHSIYVAAMNRTGVILGRPCEEICYREIRENTPIKHVYYTTYGREIGHEIVSR